MVAKVMIVDDLAMMRMVIKAFVENMPGFEIVAQRMQMASWRWSSCRNIPT